MGETFEPARGYDIAGFQSAAGYSTVGQFLPDRSKRCIAKNHTCMGWRAKGTKFCIGHLRKLGLLVEVVEEEEEVSDDDPE